MIKTLVLSNNEIGDRVKIQGNSILFTPGLNYVVGKNGSGKSTLLKMLYNYSVLRSKDSESKKIKARKLGIESIELYHSKNTCTLRYFDSEDTPRTNRDTNPNMSGDDLKTMIFSIFISHGQFSKKVIDSLRTFPEGDIIVIDEPEVGLDLDALINVKSILEEVSDKIQIIASTHNPILLSSSKCNYICLDGFDVKKYVQDYANHLLG